MMLTKLSCEVGAREVTLYDDENIKKKYYIISAQS